MNNRKLKEFIHIINQRLTQINRSFNLNEWYIYAILNTKYPALHWNVNQKVKLKSRHLL
jgi:hypothetical protein